MDAQLNLRLSEGLLDRLRERSRVSGVPASRIVRDAIEHVLGEEPRTPLPRSEGVLTTPEVKAGYTRLVERELGPSVAASLKPFRCPAPVCEFASTSEAARCPSHGRKVIAT